MLYGDGPLWIWGDVCISLCLLENGAGWLALDVPEIDQMLLLHTYFCAFATQLLSPGRWTLQRLLPTHQLHPSKTSQQPSGRVGSPPRHVQSVHISLWPLLPLSPRLDYCRNLLVGPPTVCLAVL